MSTSAPATSSTLVGLDLYDALAPLAYADAAVGWALWNYVNAIGLVLDDEAQLVRTDDDGNDGWSAFADPDRCPDSYLFTLAQWAGVRYPRRMTTSELRALIGPQAPGLWRGTRAAIIATVQRYLPAGASIYFEERADGDAYKLRIFTYNTDAATQAAIQTELMNHIPAGLILDYQVRVGQNYAQANTAATDYTNARSKWPTYAAGLAAPPP